MGYFFVISLITYQYFIYANLKINISVVFDVTLASHYFCFKYLDRVKLVIFQTSDIIDILYTLDSASLLVKLKPRIFQRLPPFE